MKVKNPLMGNGINKLRKGSVMDSKPLEGVKVGQQ